SNQDWLSRPKISNRPLTGAVTVFTDAGKKSKKAAFVWHEGNQWRQQLIDGQPHDSLQTLELAAIVHVFLKWMHTPLNVVSDSLYAVGVVQRIEDALLKEVRNQRLNLLFA
ncbi:POK6 protein, partial [Syrrhaptes paradoxus]|nr:POK6 protein [Syrrhaptes paradoxus]